MSRVQIAFFDMDSTIIANECIDELAAMCGVGEQVAAITRGAMEQGWDFEESLRRRIESLIKAGLREEQLQQCYDERIRLNPGAEELLRALKKEGVYCVLVSGGFDFFTSRMAERLGFDAHYSNRLRFEEERLAGVEGCPAFEQRIIGKEAKRDIVLSVVACRGMSLAEAAFVGDGGNDALAVKTVTEAGGIGVAYRAKNTALHEAANLQTENLAELIPHFCG